MVGAGAGSGAGTGIGAGAGGGSTGAGGGTGAVGATGSMMSSAAAAASPAASSIGAGAGTASATSSTTVSTGPGGGGEGLVGSAGGGGVGAGGGGGSGAGGAGGVAAGSSPPSRMGPEEELSASSEASATSSASGAGGRESGMPGPPTGRSAEGFGDRGPDGTTTGGVPAATTTVEPAASDHAAVQSGASTWTAAPGSGERRSAMLPRPAAGSGARGPTGPAGRPANGGVAVSAVASTTSADGRSAGPCGDGCATTAKAVAARTPAAARRCARRAAGVRLGCAMSFSGRVRGFPVTVDGSAVPGWLGHAPEG